MSDGAKVIPIEAWLTSFREAAGEVAKDSLRFGTASVKDEESAPHPGAYISLLSDQHSVHLGLSASPDGCRAIARGFLGMHPDQPIEDQAVADGVREVMNIVAGKVKSKMAGKDGVLQMGLPMFLSSAAHPSAEERVAADLQIGSVDCTLVVYRSKRAA